MGTPMITVTPFPGPAAFYNQITGVPIKLALLDPKTHTELHTPVMCKDYIQDAFWTEKTKRPANVYGFNWTAGTLDLSHKHYELEVIFDNDNIAVFAPRIQALLNEWEKRLKFARTTIRRTNDPKQIVLRFSQAWTKAPIRLSLFTMSVRIGAAYDHPSVPEFIAALPALKIPQPSDQGILKTGASALMTKIWNDAKFPEQTYEQFKTYHAAHSGSGLWATARAMKLT